MQRWQATLFERVRRGAQARTSSASRRTSGWRRVAWRWGRDTAVALLVLMIASTGLSVALGRSKAWFFGLSDAWLSRHAEQRTLLVPVDSTIDAGDAGRALARVLPVVRRIDLFTQRDLGGAAARVAAITAPDSTAFPTLRRVGASAMPAEKGLIAAASGALAPGERDWLARMAALPIWDDVQLVARAPSVDVLAARLALRSADADPASAPEWSRNAAERLTRAAVARAAWHVHRGEYAEAEAALRTMIAFGYAVLDDGLTWSEYAIGSFVLRIALRAMSQLAEVRGDAPLRELSRTTSAVDELDVMRRSREEQLADRVFAFIGDQRTPRASRGSLLLEFAPDIPCLTLRGVVMGRSASESARVAAARASLARTPLEHRLLATAERPDSAVIAPNDTRWTRDPLAAAALGASVFTSHVTGNPRFAACMARVI